MPLPTAGLTRRARVLLGASLLVLGLASWHRLYLADLPGPLFEFSGETMGTTFRVKVAADSMSRSEYRAVSDSILAILDAVDGAMSTWDPDSELSRFNSGPDAAAFPASDELLEVFRAAEEVSQLSQGAFDVTVAPLVQAWGFGANARMPGGPDAAELAVLRRRVGWQLVDIDAEAGSLSKRYADTVCDLSAIAKGYAVDRVTAGLLQRGYTATLVEVGGELRASGTKRGNAPWRVAIEVPDGLREVHDVIPLTDLAMATSGDYRDYYELDGVRISHTIDPRTGRPIHHALASVTVIHRDATYADAFATALNVLGPEEGYALAQELNLAAYFILRTKDGTFTSAETLPFAELRIGPVAAGQAGTRAADKR